MYNLHLYRTAIPERHHIPLFISNTLKILEGVLIYISNIHFSFFFQTFNDYLKPCDKAISERYVIEAIFAESCLFIALLKHVISYWGLNKSCSMNAMFKKKNRKLMQNPLLCLFKTMLKQVILYQRRFTVNFS